MLHELGLWLSGVLAAIGIGGAPAPSAWQGWIEGDWVRVAAPVGGTLARVDVTRGADIAAGAPLFALDLTAEQAGRAGDVARLAESEARLADLRKGQRPEELRTLEAQRAQAAATLRLSEAELRRQEALVRTGTVAQQRADEARSNAARDRAALEQMESQWRVATLGGREDQIRAAEAAVAANRAALAQRDRRLVEMAPPAPVGARVEDVYYRPGEWISAGMPVVALLPPGNLKLRFFVPETQLGSIALGQPVAVACDGCPAGMTARIARIAPRAEYTPPVIYSVGSREKLVFLVEALPDGDTARLHPGQPVDIRPQDQRP